MMWTVLISIKERSCERKALQQPGSGFMEDGKSEWHSRLQLQKTDWEVLYV